MCRQCVIRLQQIRTQFLAPHLLNQFHEVALQYDVDQLRSLYRRLSACKSVHVFKELNCFLHREHKTTSVACFGLSLQKIMLFNKLNVSYNQANM